MNRFTKISVIVATLGDRVMELKRMLETLENQTYSHLEVILVLQQEQDTWSEVLAGYKLTTRVVMMQERGLSKARNLGLEYATGDIVTFGDDDCWYAPETFEHVVASFQTGKDVISFNMYDPDRQQFGRLQHIQTSKFLTKRELMSRSSIEIFVKRSCLEKNEAGPAIRFDEVFGLGATYISGEENIFLSDLFRQGYVTYFHPECLVYHAVQPRITRLTEAQMLSKGPLFKRMYSTPTAFLLVSLFYIKKKQKNLFWEVLQATWTYQPRGER
ncbi:glycosyltransferase family 2 protein [Paenilisteria rocourtiae]|uniref:Glycosyltransferase involved in cell wall biosynthesis n=1 Tax=Listeria rocourtiae TaxID=647910 RepID=A0A4R6ZRA7_9LIST|nr:glycosyltransferase family 2 protein [Listeria rocourtiae]EUJ48381.1 glycosyltransferase [Listeria rocourtiae FSL F6-920]MBC1605873.1 glycosyltransferase family 2 protein [Listeria rocourtiae]TDR54754.1 glycosyltransferase involved in cell wall biosynthesis [Listeria rocourtiae]